MDIIYQCVQDMPTFTQGVATFEYDVTDMCGPGERAIWGDWSWESSTPGDSKITFEVATGERDSGGTITNLSADVPLRFTRSGLNAASVPPMGEAACASQADTCISGVDTQIVGVFDVRVDDVAVNDTLELESLTVDNNYLRIRATLTPSSDGTQAPTLVDWELRVTCEASE
jgi:hypothetical protein